MKAFSTLEVLIASVTLMTAVSGCVLITIALPRSLENGKLSLRAMWQMENIVDRSLHEHREHFSSTAIAGTTSESYNLSFSVSSTSNEFTHLLSATTRWNDTYNRERSSSLLGLVTNIGRPLVPDLCDSTTASSWIHPSMTTYTFNDLLPITVPNTTHAISGLAVSSSTLAVTILNASASTDATFFLFDITPSGKPVFLSAADLAPSTKLGIASTAIQGSYAYVASAAQPNFSTCTQGPACSQLQILDIQDPVHPVLVSNTKLSVSDAPYAVGTGGQSSGKAIAFGNSRYVYLGLTKTGSTSGQEFNIIDVQDPHMPLWRGGFHVGRTVTSITVRGIYAYVTTDDPAKGLLVLNIHDPAHVTEIAHYTVPGTSIYTYPQSLSISSTTILIGRTYAPNQPELLALNVQDVSNPTLTQSAETAASSSPWNIDAVVTSGSTAFVLKDSGIDSWNIGTSSLVEQMGSTLPTPYQTKGAALACRNNTLYMTSISSSSVGYLSVITSSL